MARTYERKFDWDEAQRLYDEGVPLEWIASKLHVTTTAIRRIVVPGAMEKMAAYSKQYPHGKTHCKNCGASTNLFSHNRGLGLCKTCAAIERRTTIRETELLCGTCKRWLPDEAFHGGSADNLRARRGRRRDCRDCSNKRRTRYRQTHRIPCKGGCGRTVSPSDQRANAKSQNRPNFKVGYCGVCNRQLQQAKPKLSGAAAFRKKFGTAADRADTTNPDREESDAR